MWARTWVADLLGDVRWARQSVRSRDRTTTAVALLLWGAGLVLFGFVLLEHDSTNWWLWLAAAVAAIAGVLLGAPVFTGRFLVTCVVLGLMVSGTALLRVGVDHLFEVERGTARDAASLMAYVVWDVTEPGSPPSAPTTGEQLAAADLLTAQERAETAVEDLCNDADGVFDPELAPACAVRSPGDAASGAVSAGPASDRVVEARQLAVARASAQLAVADLEVARAQALDASDTTKAARVEAARATRAQAREALQSAEEVARVDVARALSAGTGELVDGVLPAGSPFPLAPGVVVWALTALAVACLLRWTAVLNATRGLGPVSLELPEEKDADWQPCQERFRIHLLDNVPEPGSVPNAEALSKVATLIGTTVPAAEGGSKLLAEALTTLRDALIVTRGYAVEVAVVRRPPAEAAAGTDASAASVALGLVVRIRKARTRALLEQREFLFGADGRERAVREAALWAAAVIVGNSRSVPGWARWSPDAAGPLARLGHEQQELRARDGAATRDGDWGPVLERLEEAAQASPNSGRLLLELAHVEEMAAFTAPEGAEGQPASGRPAQPIIHLVAALRHTFDAVGLYPRYLDARYRLASEAGLLAGVLSGEASDQVSADEITGELHALRQVVERHLGLDDPLTRALVDHLQDPRTGLGGLASALRRFSIRERRREWRRRSPVVVLLNGLRATERDRWLGELRHGRHRSDAQRRVISARLIAAAAEALADTNADPDAATTAAEDRWKRLSWTDRAWLRWLTNRAKRADVVWQVPYNLACCHANLAVASPDPGRSESLAAAEDLLERARIARGSEQLTRAWLNLDPDLKVLRDHDPGWWSSFVPRCPAARSGTWAPLPSRPASAGSEASDATTVPGRPSGLSLEIRHTEEIVDRLLLQGATDA
jgi:hypothetical protein